MQTNSLNTPYVKQFDANGNLTNRISGYYASYYENRKMRRLREKGIVRKNNKASTCGSWVQKVYCTKTYKVKYVRHIA